MVSYVDPEAVIWWSVTAAVILTRYVVRLPRNKWRLDIPDWIMLAITFLYSGTVAVRSVITHDYSELNADKSNSYKSLDAMSEETKDKWGRLVIMAFATELTSITTQYMVKACLLTVYHLLTINRRTNLFNKIVAGYTLITYIVIMTLVLAVWCRPLKTAWDLDLLKPHTQCSTFINHHITVIAGSVSSDLLIMLVPMPMLLRTSFTLLRKLFLVCVFSMGIFSIFACLYARMSLVLWQEHHKSGDSYNRDWPLWIVRELSLIVIVGNVYYLAPLARTMEAKFSSYILRKKGRKSSGFSHLMQPSPLDPESQREATVLRRQRDSDFEKDCDLQIPYLTKHPT